MNLNIESENSSKESRGAAKFLRGGDGQGGFEISPRGLEMVPSNRK